MNTFDSRMAPRILQLLEERLGELRETLDPSRHLQEAPDGREVADFKDAASEESMAFVDDAQSGHAASELRLVIAARQRLAARDYGTCVDCGEAIDLQRLLAVPWTPHCLA